MTTTDPLERGGSGSKGWRRSRFIAGVLAAALAAGACVAFVATHRYLTGALQLNRPSPERFPVRGIDVSHHQGAIDWTKVPASEVRFAYVKATEGGDFVDGMFANNVLDARAAGIRAGPYHFFTFCTPGAEQAEHFLRTAIPSADSLPPVVDVEFGGNCKSWSDLAAVRAELAVFLAQVEDAWGVKPILYVTKDALRRVIADELPGQPIWIRSVYFEPALDSHRGWLIWQYSDNSRVPGISGPVDRNALRPGATLQDLRVPGG